MNTTNHQSEETKSLAGEAKSLRPGQVDTSGHNPEAEAWSTAFFIENHLDYVTYPYRVSSPEKIQFMVYTEEAQRYYPCSDQMFEVIMGRKQSVFLQKQYNEVLQRILELIDRTIEDAWEKSYLESLITIKYQHETQYEIMIPSRLEKRLMKIFINRTQIEDPFMDEKSIRNRRAAVSLESDAFKRAFNHIEPSELEDPPETLSEIKNLIEFVAFRRLIAMTSEPAIWESDEHSGCEKKDYQKLFNRPVTGNGTGALYSFLGFHRDGLATRKPKKILWLADESGEIMVDLAIIRYLTGLGHKIIISFKEGPLFTKTDFYDAQDDEQLRWKLENARSISEKNLSKNQLVQMLRSGNKIFVISDGTSEMLNLLLTSTTFARAFKEVDGVISRGNDQRRRLFETRFQYTQDIFNISGDGTGGVSIQYKPKHPMAIKFSHEDLEKKARTITDRMEAAQGKGMTVIFYSGIIGSIPGKIDMAKKIMAVFVELLKNQAPMTFIINPSDYFEPGMDADDLMYMWEIVQRSGRIDIWRFQTNDDINRAFQIIGKKVPPEWVGKDATFSTGCTKEMRIAIEVQKQFPEMQIIGPSEEKFMRRDEYGVGSMYDRRLME